jgi:hypothetical protein
MFNELRRAPTTRETGLDDTIESSFPASDPPSSIPDPLDRALETPSYRDGRLGRVIDAAQNLNVPQDPFLWAAVASMGVSASLQLAGKRHASLFVGQWAPAFLLLGVYNRLVKQSGSDGYSHR